MFDKRHFIVTENHIKLLRRAYVSWEDCEFGAPAIDPKRPYGNSSVYQDIAEIINVKPMGENSEFTELQESAMRQLHKETQMALQIFLATGEMRAGEYAADRYSANWQLAAQTEARDE